MRVGDYEIEVRAVVIMALLVLSGLAAAFLLTRDSGADNVTDSVTNSISAATGPDGTVSRPAGGVAPGDTAGPTDPTVPATVPPATATLTIPPKIPTGDPKVVVRVGSVSYREPDVVAMMKTLQRGGLPAKGSAEYQQLRSMAASLLVRDEVLRRGVDSLGVAIPTDAEIEELAGPTVDKRQVRRGLLTEAVSKRLVPDGGQTARAAAFERWLAKLALEYDAQVYLGD